MRFSPFAWRRAQKPPLPGKRGWVTLCHVSLPGSETGNAVVFLEPVQEEGNDGHHGKVIGADDEENLREAEGIGGYDFAFAHEFHAGHEVGEGGVFDQINDFVATARQSPAGCLGCDDPDYGLQGTEAEGLGGLELSLFDGEKRSAHVFGMIGCRAEYEAQESCAERLEIDADLGECVIDHHQLDGQRNAADESCVGIAKPAHPGTAERAQASESESTEESQDGSGNDEFNGYHQSPVERGKQLAEHEVGIKHGNRSPYR